MFNQTTAVVISEDSHGGSIKDTPVIFTNNGTIQSTCTFEDIEYTNGQTLFGETIMTLQESCKPSTGNAGNWYSWPGATVGGSNSVDGQNELNSVCPHNWQLTSNIETDTKSWQYLIQNTYNVFDKNDEKVRIPPLSFIRSGYYITSPSGRKTYGLYWSSMAFSSIYAYSLFISNSDLDSQHHSYIVYGAYHWRNKDTGYSLRCGGVSRLTKWLWYDIM